MKPVVIKRYASRRLYNTDTSEYVTLDEISSLVRQGHDIEIIDSKTGDNLTRQFLLQIITEQENGSQSILPINVLMDVVRSYSDQAGTVIPDFLSNSFEMLKTQQKELLASTKKNIPENLNPMEIFSLASWQKAQSELLKSTLGSWGLDVSADQKTDASQTPDAVPAKTTSKDDEIAEMKRQLAMMQEKLRNL